MVKAGERTGSLKQLSLSVFVGGVIVIMTAFAILLLCAAMISSGLMGQPDPLRPVLSACVLGGGLGGFFTCLNWPSHRFPAGLACALTGFALLLLIRLAVVGSLDIGASMLPVLLGTLCGGGLAGVITAGKKTRKKRRLY